MRLTWETAVIVVAVIAGVVLLSMYGQAAAAGTVAALLGLATTLLSAANLVGVREVKQQTNGTVSALTDELSATRRALADLAKTTVPAELATRPQPPEDQRHDEHL